MEAKVITVVNKLPRKDSVTNLDVWYPKILHNIQFSSEKVENVVGTDVSMGQSFVILVPFNELYRNYQDWKKEPDKYYTMSVGDYIFLGTEIVEPITSNNIQQLKKQYEPNVCEVRYIKQVDCKFGVKIQLRVEGV